MKHFKFERKFYKQLLNEDFMVVDTHAVYPSIGVVAKEHVNILGAEEITERMFYKSFDAIATELEDECGQ